ncbi:protein MMS22-like [Liolophura sinensis]|uniref:protein MMS22-like n=1 Tax=Liolophura sinensis TaxID=3198878 RepID=UPI003158644D
MEIQDSCSMTPPLSPMGFNLVEDELPGVIPGHDPQDPDPVSDRAVVFLCNGEDRLGMCENFHPAGPLLSGSIHSLVSNEELTTPGILLGSNTCVLFGNYFTPQTALTEHLHSLFQFAKLWISKIELFPGASLTKDESEVFLTARRELKEFLDYVILFITKYMSSEQQPYLCHEISVQLQALLQYLGRLSEHRTFTGGVSRGSKNPTKASHHFHMHMDMYWGVLQIMMKLDQICAGNSPQVTICCNKNDSSVTESLTSQLTQLILWDLVTICADRYNKLSPSDRLRLSAFPCSCVREFLVILIHLLSWRQKSGHGQDFWFDFHSTAQGLLTCTRDDGSVDSMDTDSSVFYNPPEISVDKPAPLCLWLMAQIAPLFAYDDRGQYNAISAVQSNYPLAQTLIKACITSPNVDESQLQHYLRYCVKLSHLWEPNVTMVMTLWDYFSGKLNSNFQVASMGIHGLASIRKTAVSFLTDCKSLTQRDVVLRRLEQEDSFSLFLHILSDHLHRFLERGSSQEWRQLKGRIFSKFHTRRMQELGETGLNNLTKLFVTLMLVVKPDLDTMVNKLCAFYELLDFSMLDTKRKRAVWKGMFSLVIIHLEKKQDLSFLAERMSTSFNACCSEFCQPNLDSMQKQKVWELLSFYLENLSDVLDQSSHLNLSQHKLIGQGLSQILPVCGENELRHVLSTCLNILANVRNFCSSQNQDVSVVDGARAWIDILWQSVYPFCKNHATTHTPPPELADLIACLCMSTAQIGEDNQSVCSIFQYFALNEDVNVRCSCRFLNHVLQNTPVVDALSQSLPDYQTCLIQTWLRCALLSPSSSQDCLNINRIMCQMSDVKAVFEKAEMELPAVVETSLLQFVKAMGRCYNKAESLMNKIAYRTKACLYCRDVIRYVTPILRNYGPAESLSCVYNMTGHLVKYCAPLLYVKSQPDCPLPAIIDRLVLPHSLFDHRKTVHPNLLTTLREHLHLFVQGLAQLDYRRDPYIQRRVKDILVQFLQRFPVACLGKALSKTPTEESSKFRQFILSLVVENFLKVTSMTLPPNAVMGLSYITEVFKRTMSVDEITRDTVSLLEVLLEISLVADNSPLRDHVNALLQVLFEACAKRSDTQLTLSLVGPLQRFAEKYVRLNAPGVLGGSLERVAVLYPDLLIQLLPSLTDTLLAIERKRGVGRDKQLRSSYVKLLKILGERGMEEMQKMEMSNAD